jgi:hypothetical protein
MLLWSNRASRSPANSGRELGSSSLLNRFGRRNLLRVACFRGKAEGAGHRVILHPVILHPTLLGELGVATVLAGGILAYRPAEKSNDSANNSRSTANHWLCMSWRRHLVYCWLASAVTKLLAPIINCDRGYTPTLRIKLACFCRISAEAVTCGRSPCSPSPSLCLL